MTKPGERPFRDAAWFYAEYRYRPSEAFARLLAGHLGWSRSDRVLDLGAGPAHVSLRLAPFVGEVVVMDPEPAMIEEGRRRAAAAEIDNLSFVVGGSDDLARLSPELGELTTVTIAQAFHWMADQDAVLRAPDDQGRMRHERQIAFDRPQVPSLEGRDDGPLTIRLAEHGMIGRDSFGGND